MESIKRDISGIQESSPEIPAGRQYFLGIGVDTYQHFPSLNNASKDVQDLCAILCEHYYFDPADTLLLTGTMATRRNILRQINDYRRRLTRDDRLLIYYAGHGLFDEGLGFWIPAEAERDEISTYISNAEVREIVRNMHARHILLISDSCFSAALLVRDASRDSRTVEGFDRNPSRWVFISGKGVVSDGQPGENSPFAAGILKYLRQNVDKAVNIAHLADHVTKEVRFNYEQQAEAGPLYQAGHEGGQFVFRRRQIEADLWATALQTDTEGSFLNYLKQYPDGQFVGEAEKHLTELADQRAWTKATQQDAAFAFRTYLRDYPQGLHATEAHARLDALLAVENERITEQHRAEKEARDHAEKERLEKAAIARAEREQQEKTAAARAQQEHETNARAEKERLEKAAIARAEREQQEKTAAARAQQEHETNARAEKERLEKAAIARAEREQQEKAAAARAQQEHETNARAEKERLEKAANARAKREQQEKAAAARAQQEHEAQQQRAQQRQMDANTLLPMQDDHTDTGGQSALLIPVGMGVLALVIAIALYVLFSGPPKTDVKPQKPPVETATDRDQDGVADKDDNCPDEKGITAYSGCPPPANQTPLVSNKPAGDTLKPAVPSVAKTQKPAVPSVAKTQKPAKPSAAELEAQRIKANQQAAQQRAAEDAQRARSAAKPFLQNALAQLSADEPSEAQSALSEALKIANLPGELERAIRGVKAQISAIEYVTAQNQLKNILKER